MTDQTKNVETLQKDVDLVAAELAEAKKLEDEALQKIQAEAATLKAEAILNEVKTAKEEANIKLKSLEGKTDAISKAEIVKLEAEIKKYEAMLITLNSTKDELITLKAGVVAPIVDENDDKNKDEEKDEEKPEEEKKNRFRRQIDGLSDKTEENHALKNAGRIAMGIGAGVLVWKWLKALFGGNKEKKAKTAWSEKTFLQKVWSVTKVVAVGWGLYYVIHGLATGKWSLNDFFDRKEKPGYESNDPETFDNLYENKSKEEKEQYDNLWTAVNEFFTKVYGTSTGDSWSDMLGEQTGDDKFEKHVWTMPCALDESSSDVGDILDGTSDFNKKLDDFGAKVSKDVGKQINPLERFSGNWASTEDLAKLDKETVRKYQAYRKTLKVQVFLHQKEKVLVRRLIAEKLGITDYASASEDTKKSYDERIDTAMEDDDIMDGINTKMENIYYNKKLTGVMAVLKKYDISNEEMLEDTENTIKEVDQDKNDLIGDTLDRATASADVNADDTLKSDLEEVCTDFDTKINDEDNQLMDFDNFFIGLGDAWLNMESGDKKKVLESIWYKDKIGVYSTKISAIKEKITNGTATKTDIAELKKTIDDYYIFKKDIVLWISFVHEADDKNTGLERTMMYIWGKLIAVLEWAWEKGGIVGVTIAAFVMRNAGKAVLKWWSKLTLAAGKNRIRWLAKDPGRLILGRRQLRRLRMGQNWPMKWMRRQAYKWDTWYKLFETDFKAWKVKLDEAQQIIDINGKGRTNTKSIDELLSLGWYVQKWDTISDIKIINSYFDKNKNFRLAVKNRSIRQKVLVWVKEYDAKLTSLTNAWETKRAKLLEEYFGYARFKKWDELSGLVKNIDAIDISDLDDVQIKDLAKKLGKKITATSTASDITKHIDEIKKTVTTTVDVIDNIKLKEITKNIDDQLVIMKKTLTDMGTEAKPWASFSKIRVNYYEKSIEGLENFKKQAHLMTEVDFNTIKKMTKYGFELNSIAKLRGIIEADAAWVIDNAVKQGDVRLLRDILRDNAINDVNLLKKVTKTDIDEVVGNLDVLIKKSAAVTDDVTPLLKNMDNIFRLFTKLT